MIDIESAVFTRIATTLRERFPGITVSPEYPGERAKLPFATIFEADNYLDSRYLDGSTGERFAKLMYEVNVYSSSVGTKKAQCRTILGNIDEMMYAMNFARISMNPVPTVEGASIYRLNARYEAVSDGKKIYRK